jgi:hypothetical protein
MIIDREELVSVFMDTYDENITGYVRKISDELLLLEAYELHQLAGFKILNLDDITRIRWGNSELKYIHSAIKANLSHNENKINYDINIENKIDAVKSMQKLFGHVTLYMQHLNRNVCFIGEVSEIDEDTIILHEFGTFESQSRSYLLLAVQDINRIDANGIYEKQLLQRFGR